MKTYHLNYTVTPSSSYEKTDFWIDIRNKHLTLQAENVKQAMQQLVEVMDRDWCIVISKNGLKTASAMYRDVEGAEPVQVGYVVKAKTEIDFDTEWKQRYVEIWVSIREEIIPDFDEE